MIRLKLHTADKEFFLNQGYSELFPDSDYLYKNFATLDDARNEFVYLHNNYSDKIIEMIIEDSSEDIPI